MKRAYILKKRCQKPPCMNIWVTICSGMKLSDFGKYRPRIIDRSIPKALRAVTSASHIITFSRIIFFTTGGNPKNPLPYPFIKLLFVSYYFNCRAIQ
jgi:hypothetical protein